MSAIPNFIQTVRGRKNTEYLDGIIPLAASQVLSAYGSRFLTLDGSGNAVLSGAASTQIDRWTDTCYMPDHSGASTQTNVTPFQGSSSAGVSNCEGTENVHTEDDAVWIPSADTLTVAMTGTICDLIITGAGVTTLQLLKPTVNVRSVVKILNVNVKDQLALVYAVK